MSPFEMLEFEFLEELRDVRKSEFDFASVLACARLNTDTMELRLTIPEMERLKQHYLLLGIRASVDRD